LSETEATNCRYGSGQSIDSRYGTRCCMWVQHHVEEELKKKRPPHLAGQGLPVADPELVEVDTFSPNHPGGGATGVYGVRWNVWSYVGKSPNPRWLWHADWPPQWKRGTSLANFELVKMVLTATKSFIWAILASVTSILLMAEGIWTSSK